MDDAQRRVDQIRAFRAEIEALEAANLFPLTPDEKRRIAAYHNELLQRLVADYDVDSSETAGQLSRGMRLLSVFGAVALTAALYSLVERFWGRLDLPLQATLLTTFPLMALAGVELSARRERTLYVAGLFAVAACGAFWLAVGVLSEILNVPVAAPFLWLGVLFALPLALAYRLRIILAVALASFAVAGPATVFQLAGVPWSEMFSRLDLLGAAGFSLLILVPPLRPIDRDFPPVVRFVSLVIGLTSVLILSTSGDSILPIDREIVKVVYQSAMFVLSIVALVVAVRRGWNETVSLVAVLFAVFLLIRYVDWFWDLVPRYAFFLMLAVLAFAWLLVLRRVRGRMTGARA